MVDPYSYSTAWLGIPEENLRFFLLHTALTDMSVFLTHLKSFRFHSSQVKFDQPLLPCSHSFQIYFLSLFYTIPMPVCNICAIFFTLFCGAEGSLHLHCCNKCIKLSDELDAAERQRIEVSKL